MSDATEAIRDILGMPVARPILTTAVPSDELAAAADDHRDRIEVR
ncbi:hypothetical protein [Leifsonia sp. P73]